MHSWWRHQMKQFSALWPFVLVNSPHKGQCRGSLMLPLICAWTNGWANNREAGDLRRYGAYYEVIVMLNEDVSIHYIAFVMKTTADVVVMDHTPGTHATPAILWVLCRILPLRWMRFHIPCYMNGQIIKINIFYRNTCDDSCLIKSSLTLYIYKYGTDESHINHDETKMLSWNKIITFIW